MTFAADNDPGSPLPLRFAMYLPTGSEGSSTASLAAIEAIESLLCERFGGATSYPAKGLFKRSSGTVERECVQVIETYCEADAWENSEQLVFNWAAKLATLLNQESIACSVQGRMHFVEPNPEDAPLSEIRGDILQDLAELGIVPR